MTRERWITLLVVSAATAMLLLDVTVVNVALPAIRADLDASFGEMQWVIDAYALTLAALLLTAGSLADRYGRRLLFAIGIVVFTLGSLACGVAPSALVLSLSRAFQGIGGAIMFATGLALIADAFQGPDRGVAFGVFGATTGIAVAVGPVLGGALTSGLSWRFIFLVNVPVGLATLTVTLRAVRESRDAHARPVDILGLSTFSVGLAALVFGLIRSSEDGWGSGTVIASLALSAALLVAFVAAEALQRAPMFDLTLFRKPTFVGGLIAAFAISASLFSTFPYLVIYLQTGLGLSAIEVGVRFLVLSVPIFITAAIAGRLTDRVPAGLLIGPGFALVGISLLLMRGLEPGMSWTHLIPGFIVAGIGAGLIN
ncbi:MAG TPA: DHA2 family efflux MFS transporter permease subunit, partial [Solirubrobacterales bacterium]|nr:DHA2 family efflux MFS transporter permease subunit [Solirubrobacterales bacterium]